MSLPIDYIENLQRSMETLARIPEELRRKLLLSPSAAIMEAVKHHNELLPSLHPYDGRRTLVGTLLSTSAPFLQAAKDALKLEAMQSQTAISEDIRRSVAGLPISSLAFFGAHNKQLERTISDSILRLTSSPLALIRNDMQRTVEQVSSKLAAEADLSKLYSTILKMNPGNTLSDLLAAVENEQFEDFHTQSDGSIVVDGDAITSGDMQQAISELLNEPENFLRNLGERLASLAKPLRLIFVWLLKNAVLPLLILSYSDYDADNKFHELQKMIRQEADDTRRSLRAAIKEVAQAHPKLSPQWRVIIRPVKVMSHPANRAAIIDSLPISSVAWLVEKRGAWVLIQYESPGTEITMTGWVTSKYAKRIE